MLEVLIPPGLPPLVAALLLLASVFTSMITAAFGAGGGVLLLGIMALWLPPVAIVPVHGLIQLGSNSGRFAMTWRKVDWGVLAAFAPGVVLGMAAGALVLVRLPESAWQLTIAGFILWLCWGPPIPKSALGKPGIFLASTLTSFITLFVGATGPLVAAFIKQLHTDRFRTIATFSGAMTLQHLPKILVFGFAGFVFTEWIVWVLAMIGCGLIGTWLGLRLVNRMSNRVFQRLFTIILTLLALRLVWQALS
ncbi:putative membrane protein YfcA [Halospina denitrificans]|uniref:Probable membrane transporter protein n=1 Tax=Halospina denitrificans TaxID=332522 RepID=A0A4R7JTU8_9GAMM|nr:sulfite exporter TauE/SafE family protein [Halospina denitrificans]TDT41465.1 putative membrane protein YfcA [Halospina denitrificans]